MYSSCREEIVEVFDALEADLDRALELSFDALTTPERLVMLARSEVFRRRLPALEHPLINQIGRQADARNWAASWRCAGRPAAHHPHGSLAPHWRGRRAGRPEGRGHRTRACCRAMLPPAFSGLLTQAQLRLSRCNSAPRRAPRLGPERIARNLRRRNCYSPVNCGERLAKVAEIPSDRSLDGRNAAFHAAT
jgi:hypothetical protein